MGRSSLVLLSFLSSLLVAEPLTQDQAIQKGSALSSALVQKLSGELKAQMQSAGAVGALHFCTQNALVFTAQIAQESNTSIKRVSAKNRNPINAATPEEQSVLTQWEGLLHTQQPLPAYKIQASSNGEYTYYKPIVITNEACLKCHGDIAADSPLYKAIKATYPEDKATGYKMGDLRGMIVITIQKQN